MFAAAGTLFTFSMTVLGAAMVFFFRRRISPRTSRICFGFAGGVMSAAAVFSLLLPAIEQLRASGGTAWAAVALAFAAGAGAMLALDLWMQRFEDRMDSAAHRRAMLLGAITLHNIPEGMAVGVAFAAAGNAGGAAMAAAAVALGIGVQNIPEGAAIALPMRQSGMSRTRSFMLGALSGAVEPLAGMAAVLAVSIAGGMMPMLMAFSAGAMMWVVFSEMLPQSSVQRDGALAASAGYLIMMALDLWLG